MNKIICGYRVSPDGTSPIVILEGRIALVGKVWMGGFDVAITIPKSLIYHGNEYANVGEEKVDNGKA